jgi:anhydro-N-acetylmuramic acid kinase
MLSCDYISLIFTFTAPAAKPAIELSYRMRSYLGIGLMSGTSMDGLDIACCRFEENGDMYRFELVASEQVAFPEIWKSRLTNLPDQTAEVYAKTHVYFGHWLGQTVRDFIRQQGLRPDFVAAHGQTIFHQPEKNFTAQIGDGETLAAYLECPVVSNFRNKDVALGGEGAPLVPLGEKYLFPDQQLFLNLGGFSNLSYIDVAFDVSPCNIVLNYLVGKIDHEPRLEYDPEGSIATSGQPDTELLQQLNQLPFFQKSPPKSLGWEWVESQVLPMLAQSDRSVADLLHTYCLHIADQIGVAVDIVQAADQEILVTGGGKHNRFLMKLIQDQLIPRRIKVNTHAAAALTDYKEAIIFAFLGLRVLTGKTTALKSVTGAPFDNLSGAIHLPPRGGIRML